MSSRKKWLLRSLFALTAMVVVFSISVAQEPKKADEPPKAGEKAEEKPKLPAYFSGANDPKTPEKPTWPDPTGGAAGDTASPASDGKGDIPTKLSPEDLYNRIVHNLFSIN